MKVSTRWMTVAAASAMLMPMAQAQKSTLLILSKDDKTLSLVDPATLQVTARVPVGTNPHEVTASPDGRWAYVSNYANGSQNTITVVDLQKRAKLTAIDLGPIYGPHGLYWSAGHPFFTAEREKLIGRIDPATNKVDWLMGTGQTGTHLIWVSRDGQQIVTVNAGTSTISILKRKPVVSAEEAKKVPYSKYGGQTTKGTGGPAAPDWEESFVDIGGHPEAFDVLPDADGNPSQVWVGKYDDGTIAVVDVASKKVVDTLQVNAPTILRMRFTPNGKYAIAATDTGHDVLVVDVASKKVVANIPAGTGGGGIVCTPDSSRAFVSISPDNFVAVIDLKTMKMVGKIDAGPDPDGMWWIGQ